MICIFLTLIVLILIYYMNRQKQKKNNNKKVVIQPSPRLNEEFTNANFDRDLSDESEIQYDWNNVMVATNLDPLVKDSQEKYISEVRQYSSGSNFSAVADDNNSLTFTNWRGFSRPYYVAVEPGARQVPDYDIDVLKRNKHLKFRADYNL